MTDLTREGLVELANRVEQASGPDRELDAAVWLHLPEQEGHAWKHGGDKFAHARQIAGVAFVPRYTASLDAAMTLVPKGLWAEGSLSSPGQLEVHGPCTYDPLGKGWAATPALALCAAALKARARAMEAGRG